MLVKAKLLTSQYDLLSFLDLRGEYTGFYVEDSKSEVSRLQALIEQGSLLVGGVYEKGILISVAVLHKQYRIPNSNIPTGFYWEVYGVYTTPKYRSRGHASRLVAYLMGMVYRDGLPIILDSSKMGKSVYRKLGFKDYPHEYQKMIWRNE